MANKRVRAGLAGLGAASLVLGFIVAVSPAAAAGPQTWLAQAGAGDATGVAVMKYFPSAITINAGDAITWTAAGDAHTVAFLAPGQQPPVPGSPPSTTAAGGSTYDGTSFVNSGLILPLPPGTPAPPGTVASYSLTFPTPGTYQFHCLIHPEMVGQVVVNPAGTAYPQTQDQINAASQAAQATDIATGHQLEASFTPTVTTNANGTKTYGLAAGVGANGIEILRFISATLNLHVGDSVVWTNLSGEPHSVSFNKPPADFNESAPSGGAVFPTPNSPNAFVSSGIYLGAPAPAPNAYKLTFTKAGTYHYYCVLHDIVGMVGSLTVAAASTGGAGGTQPPTSTSNTTSGSSSTALPLLLLAGLGAAVALAGFRARSRRLG